METDSINPKKVLPESPKNILKLELLRLNKRKIKRNIIII